MGSPKSDRRDAFNRIMVNGVLEFDKKYLERTGCWDSTGKTKVKWDLNAFIG